MPILLQYNQEKLYLETNKFDLIVSRIILRITSSAIICRQKLISVGKLKIAQMLVF